MKLALKIKLLGLLVLSSQSLLALKLDRVILGCDANPKYLAFWPMVAKAWREIVGVKPTLVLIADETVMVDETLGDVYRFSPVPGIPTWFQAQNIRLLFPVKFPDEVCILSDMDMLPLARKFFVDPVSQYPDNHVIVYRDGAYDKTTKKFPICYLAAQGRVFGEILGLASAEEIPTRLQTWFSYELGWETDELVFYHYLTNWAGYQQRVVKLGLGKSQADVIDRSKWRYNPADVKAGKYYQAHLLRPYAQHQQAIDDLLKLVPAFSGVVTPQ
ncbi:MAG TPA: hypothetical protein VJJ83_05320 [Candidatus Babeliales bacterium]|nr:hypothetical protein [Candidatus Babeliales bacterium]